MAKTFIFLKVKIVPTYITCYFYFIMIISIKIKNKNNDKMIPFLPNTINIDLLICLLLLQCVFLYSVYFFHLT
jgi:hypothetical protein